MGYDKINVNAGSFGTYAAQIYMRRHGEHARTAYLSSLFTLADRVPLYHVRSAQEGLDQLFKDCEEDPACHEAYPHLREDFTALLKKTREQPVTTFVRHPVTGARTEIHFSERAFADAIRVMMYHNAQQVPFLIEQAAAGDFTPFAEAGLRANRDIYSGGRTGLHYCITCNEFVSRIRPEEIEPASREVSWARGESEPKWLPARNGRKPTYPQIISSRLISKRQRWWFQAQPIRRRGRLTSAKSYDHICLMRLSSWCRAPLTPRKTVAPDPLDTSCSETAPSRGSTSAALHKCSLRLLNFPPTRRSYREAFSAKRLDSAFPSCCLMYASLPTVGIEMAELYRRPLILGRLLTASETRFDYFARNVQQELVSFLNARS